MNILLLTPCPFEKYYGGVQAAAQLAWEAVSTAPGNARMFCYGPHCMHEGNGDSDSRICAHSRVTALARALILCGQADLVLVWHIHMLKLLPFLRQPKARVALFLHGIEVWSQIDRPMMALLDRVEVFLTNSDFTWRRFLEYHSHLKTVAHLTVALGAGQPIDAVLTPGNPPAAVILGRMSRREDYKGHRQLIQAWSQVLKRIPTAELWIVGGGDLELDLKALVARNRLGTRVRFWGVVSDEEKFTMLARCRCLVMPSRNEGFGLVYLEAMRMGRPCLVSTLDAGREVVNPPEAGLAVDPENSVALSDAVVRLMTPGTEWDGWSVGARRRYEAGFTADAFQKRLLSALAQVTGPAVLSPR